MPLCPAAQQIAPSLSAAYLRPTLNQFSSQVVDGFQNSPAAHPDTLSSFADSIETLANQLMENTGDAARNLLNLQKLQNMEKEFEQAFQQPVQTRQQFSELLKRLFKAFKETR